MKNDGGEEEIGNLGGNFCPTDVTCGVILFDNVSFDFPLILLSVYRFTIQWRRTTEDYHEEDEQAFD